MINLLVSNCWLGTWINHDKPIGFDTIDVSMPKKGPHDLTPRPSCGAKQ